MAGKGRIIVRFEYPPPEGADLRSIVLEVLRRFRRELDTGGIILRLPEEGGRWDEGDPSAHPYSDEIFFQFQGGCTFRFPGNRALRLRPCYVLLIPRGMPYDAMPDNSGGRPFGALALTVREDGCTICCAVSDGRAVRTLKNHRLRHNGFYIAVIPALQYASDGPVRRALLRALIHQVEFDLTRRAGSLPETGALPHPLAFRARRLIEDRMELAPLGVAELARRIGCSPNYLSAVFHRSYGVTLKSFILRLQLENARSMLSSGSLRASEAAGYCGFRDPSYFARIFRRHFGCTPSQLRRGAAENNFPTGG